MRKVFLVVCFFIFLFSAQTSIANNRVLFETEDEFAHAFDRYYAEVRDYWGGMITPKYEIKGTRGSFDFDYCRKTEWARSYHRFSVEYHGKYTNPSYHEAYFACYYDSELRKITRISIKSDEVWKNKECRHRFQTVSLVIARMLNLVPRDVDLEKGVFLPTYNYDGFLEKIEITDESIKKMFDEARENSDYSTKKYDRAGYIIEIDISPCRDSIEMSIEKEN